MKIDRQGAGAVVAAFNMGVLATLGALAVLEARRRNRNRELYNSHLSIAGELVRQAFAPVRTSQIGRGVDELVDAANRFMDTGEFEQ